MSEDTRQQMQQALELISTGKKQEATAILTRIIKADRDNADAWWLLANALEDPAQIRMALQNVLRLRPNSVKAQQMLDRMELESKLSAPVESLATTPSAEPADEPVDADYSFLYNEDEPKSTTPTAVQPQFTLQDSVGRQIRIPTRKTKSARGGMGMGTVILITVGGFILAGIIICAAIAISTMSLFNDVVQQLDTGTLQPGVFGSVNIEDATVRGTIEYGQTIRGNVDTFEDDGWTFRGTQGDRVMIEVYARDNSLDPQVGLFDNDNRQLAYNDDIDLAQNTDSRIEFILPATGKYTVVVSGFGLGGAYDLSLRRQ